jgi:hypothetical protein
MVLFAQKFLREEIFSCRFSTTIIQVSDLFNCPPLKMSTISRGYQILIGNSGPNRRRSRSQFQLEIHCSPAHKEMASQKPPDMIHIYIYIFNILSTCSRFEFSSQCLPCWQQNWDKLSSTAVQPVRLYERMDLNPLKKYYSVSIVRTFVWKKVFKLYI